MIPRCEQSSYEKTTKEDNSAVASWVMEELDVIKRHWSGAYTTGAKFGHELLQRQVVVPAESSTTGSLIRRVASLFYLVQGWKHQLSPLRKALTVAKMRAVLTLAKNQVALRTQVLNMDVTAFNSGVIGFKLNLLKYATPRPPSHNAMQCVRNCLRSWVCRRRLKLHRTGVRVYPVQQVRYGRSTHGFTWVNPKQKGKWGRMLAIKSTLPSRIANKPTRGHGAPTSSDWIHCMLTGRYVLSQEALQRRPLVASRMEYRCKRYTSCLMRHDWSGVAKSAWKYEYRTYKTEDFYHDYYMGDVLDATTLRPLCEMTRSRRDMSQVYRDRYLHNIEVLQRMCAKQKQGRTC